MTNVLIDPELDVLPKILLELRDDTGVGALVGRRVRAKEPAGPVLDADGRVVEVADVQPPGSYVPFVIVARLTPLPHPTVPITTVPLVVTCYGVDPRQAALIAGNAMAALHGIGVRIHPNGLCIYESTVTSGPTPGSDPDTAQPYERFIAQAVAATQVVAV